jgi:hypothetical protein
VTMSDLIKAQNMPQFNWYTCWTSLGADGTPHNLIEEGLKQPDCIKISFTIPGNWEASGLMQPPTTY